MHSKLFLAALLTSLCLHADFLYEQSSKISGGMLLQYATMLGEQGNIPTITTVAVKGGKIVYRTTKGGKLSQAQIVDLDQETITRVNFLNQTWSALTFAQMRESLNKMKQPNGTESEGVSFSLKEAKELKKMGGYDAKEVVMTVNLRGKDAQTGANAGMVITDTAWFAPGIPGAEQVRAFHKRMGEKLDWAPGGNPAMIGAPDVSRAMAAIFKKGNDYEGLPVHQVLTLNGKLGQTPSAEAGTDQVLVQTTTDLTKVSTAPVDAKWFEVPEGYKKVADAEVTVARPSGSPN